MRAPADAAASDALDRFGIAIVGMSGRFPGARDLDAFWQNLRDGVDSITRFSDRELLAAGIPATTLRDPCYVKAWGVLDDVDRFDAPFFGFAPSEAEITDPQHRLFLECAWEALEAAGYGARDFRGTVGVYAGASLNSYLLHVLATDEDLLRSETGLSMIIGNDKDFLTTRVSYKLGLTGPSIAVQTACSTSLVAVHLACQSLIAGECDMALAGGVTVRIPQTAGYWYREGHVLSAAGACRPFDAQADGTVWGSGVGVVVLRRLSDAVASRDHIHAVIKGSAVNNDGVAKIGYAAPSAVGQARAIAAALAAADVAPETIGYVEAHGTGTVLGDPIEIEGLRQAFGAGPSQEKARSRASSTRTSPCAVGSVKANIGHLGAAAGVAGLIKTVLALEHRELPASLHFERSNPQIDLAGSAFLVPSARAAWKAAGSPRRAGVSSFGVGGTNAHVVLEEAPSPADAMAARPFQLLVLSAKTDAALERATERLADHLRRHPALDLADVAYTLQVGREGFGHRRALVATDTPDAIAALQDPSRLLSAAPPSFAPPVAFMFPGGGAQSVGMGRALYDHEPVFRDSFDRCLALLDPSLARELRALLHPACRAATTLAADAPPALTRPSLALPALFAVEYALAQLWMSWGIHPQAMIGHSLGEYVAACLAGVIALADAVPLVALRGRLLEQLPSGAMLSVALSEQELAPLLHGDLSLAAVNAPSLCAVSGPAAAVAALEQHLAAKDVPCRRLAIATAAHSALVEPVLAEFAAFVAQLALHAPEIPYVSNVTGTWIAADEATSPDYWVAHLRRTVRFTAGLATLLQEPQRALLEVGPGHALSTFARHCRDAGAGHTMLPSFGYAPESEPELASLMTALARLWLAGARLDWSAFSAHERRRRVRLPTYPFERQRCWIDARKTPVGRSPSSVASPPADGLSALPRPASTPAPLPPSQPAPADATERRLADIWQRLLGIPRIDRHANFFELGGHSLLAARLFARCRQEFGRELPLSTLVHAPTIARLAAVLRRGEAAPASCLVPLQPNGARPPFFCMHAESGQVLIYRELARLFGPDQPLYALQARGLDGRSPPHASVEAMAAHYLDEIRSLQPAGPYFLGGFCLGAMIAFEMAQQLTARGEQVALLAAMDASGPRYRKAPRDYLSFALQAVRRHPLALARYVVRTRLAPRTTIVPGASPIDTAYSPAWGAVTRALNAALDRYDPRPYSGAVTWFVNAERAPLAEPQWREYATSVERWVVPGAHATIFQHPAIAVLAAQLKACLERAQAARPAAERPLAETPSA